MLWSFLPFLGRHIAKYTLRSKDSAPKIRALFFEKTQKAILERRSIPVNNRETPVSFLEAMIDAEYEDKTIADGLTSLTFASMFSTTTFSQRLICDLLSFPEHFAAIRQGLSSVLPNKQLLSFDKISELEHIDSAIRETLRHRSHLPELWRKTKSSLALGKGIVIPKGTIVAIDIPSLHFDPTHYGTSPQQKVDPISYSQQYDPFRFVNTNQKASKLTSTFYSFGAGKHACPGRVFATQLISAFITNLLQNYKLETVDGIPPPFNTQDDYFPDILIKLTPI